MSISHKKLLVILCTGSTDLVKVAIVLKSAIVRRFALSSLNLMSST